MLNLNCELWFSSSMHFELQTWAVQLLGHRLACIYLQTCVIQPFWHGWPACSRWNWERICLIFCLKCSSTLNADFTDSACVYSYILVLGLLDIGDMHLVTNCPCSAFLGQVACICKMNLGEVEFHLLSVVVLCTSVADFSYSDFLYRGSVYMWLQSCSFWA